MDGSRCPEEGREDVRALLERDKDLPRHVVGLPFYIYMTVTMIVFR